MIGRLHRRLGFTCFLSTLGIAAACSSPGGGTSSPSVATVTPAAQRGVFAHPTWATPAHLTGEVAADETVPVQVHLQLRNAPAAAEELAAISDPENERYGKFLTDAEYNAKYAPTDADIAAVRAHLEANGLVVTHVPANRTFVAARGSAAQVGRAFATRLGVYDVKGERRRAPIDVPTVPDAIAPRVLGVLGLSAPLQMKPRGVTKGGIRRDSLKPTNASLPPQAIGGFGTCSEWFGQIPDTFDPPYPGYPQLTLAPCGYTPGQLRRAYGFDTSIRKGNDGTGVTVAVVDAYLSPTLLSDAQTYAAQNDPDYPLAATQFSTYWAPGTQTPADPGWWVEQTLDVEAAHAMAPGANIVAVAAQSQSDQDLIAALNLIIEQKLATIVSNSYETQIEAGLTDALIWEAVATQAGLKGIGLYFSSGDSGDDSFGGFFRPTISFPGSLPTITSVGGTSLALGNLGQRLWETGWATGVSFLEFTPPPPPPPPDGGFPDAGLPDANDIDANITFDAAATSSPAAARLVPLDSTSDAGPVSPFSWFPPPPGQFQFGGGGGVSILFPQPTYQVGIVPSSVANQPGVPARVIPDVSMLGDPVTGFLIGGAALSGNTYVETVIGGTSLSSPLFAGVMALAQQHAKRTFGFANALLYKASKKGAFNDVLPLATPQAVAPFFGMAATFDDENQSIHTTAGFDDVTGLGSPNGQTFLSTVK